MSLDYDSVTYTPSDGVHYNVSGYTITFTLKDETAYTITYKCWIRGSGNQEITNNAKLLDYSDESKKSDMYVNASSSGSGSVLSINILKVEDGDFKVKLPGATFQLLDANMDPVTNLSGEAVYFTTDADGKARVSGNRSTDGFTIQKDTRYYLREKYAPDGYALATFDYSFMISDEADYDKYIYFDGDTLTVKDKKKTDDFSLKFKKVDENGNVMSGVTFQLLDVWKDPVTDVEGKEI